MNIPIISFVIPVYNVEQYVEQCIQSVLNQNEMHKIELVIVDDGSTDNSGMICDKFRSEEILVIHKNNEGLASARNTGLECARGQYVAFLDSDDYIAENCINYILHEINALGNPDMIFMKGIKVFPDGHTKRIDCIESKNVNGKDKRDVLRYLSGLEKYPGSSCTKLFRKSFLKNKNIWFPDDKRLGEDLPFVMDCLLSADSYAAIDINYYFYRQARLGSITSKSSYKAYNGLELFIREYADKLANSSKAKDDISELCLSFVAYEYCIAIWQLKKIDKCYQKKALSFLRAYTWLYKFAGSPRIKAILYISNAIGFYSTSCLLCAVKG